MEHEFLSKMPQKQCTLQIKWYMLNQYKFAKVIQLYVCDGILVNLLQL